MRVLSGHTSPETAYYCHDYPYGFKRCTIRYWIENRPGFGDRFVSQTQHPIKKIWNKPKTSNYTRMSVIVQEEETDQNPSYVHHFHINVHETLEKIEQFKERFYSTMGDHQKMQIDEIIERTIKAKNNYALKAKEVSHTVKEY